MLTTAPLTSVQIVVERAPLLRLCFADGSVADFGLRRSQLLLVAKDALAALILAERQ
jgi:hypothetical protein